MGKVHLDLYKIVMDVQEDADVFLEEVPGSLKWQRGKEVCCMEEGMRS